MGGCFPNSLSLRKILQRQGFSYVTKILGETERKNMVSFVDGGVMIASKWPIITTSDYIFDFTDASTADFFSEKGVVYLQVRKTVNCVSKDYHVFGTHLQAEDGDTRDHIRKMQAEEMKDFADRFRIPPEDAVVYAGDFNVDLRANTQNLGEILEKLNAELANGHEDFECTYCQETPTNPNTPHSGINAFLDYVMYSKDHAIPQISSLDVVEVKADEPFSVCSSAPMQPLHQYHHGMLCKEAMEIQHLSDHHAVVGRFQFS